MPTTTTTQARVARPGAATIAAPSTRPPAPSSGLEPRDGAVPELALAAVSERAILDVDEATARAITRTAADLAATHPGPATPDAIDDEALLLQCAVAMRTVAADLLGALLTFRVASSHDGVLLLRGMPVDAQLPPTPPDGVFGGDWRDLAVSTIGQLMVMSALGDVVAYADEKDGRLVQDVAPIPGAQDRQENSGSVLLELHTEDGFHPHKPDFLSLFGLRADHDRRAFTLAGGLRPILPLLDPRHAATLRRPEFRIRLASSFVGDRVVFADPVPVLAGSDEDPDLCVDFHAMEALTPAADDALEALRRLVLSGLVGTVLGPGDLLIVDNGKAVHGRTAFTPRHRHDDRWLRRCFAVSDLRASRPALRPHSRVHHPLDWNRR